MLPRGKCLLPAPWRAAREMEESQLVAEMKTGHLLEMAVFGIVYLVVVAGMMFVTSKRQAKRESALVRDLKVSRAQTARAAQRTRVTQVQRETARSACLSLQMSSIEGRLGACRAREATARDKEDLEVKSKLVARVEAQRQLSRSGLASLNDAFLKQENVIKHTERDLVTCRANYEAEKRAANEAKREVTPLKQTVLRQDEEIQSLKRFVGRGTKQGRAHLKQVRHRRDALLAADANLNEGARSEGEDKEPLVMVSKNPWAAFAADEDEDED
ncbi:unnamed protein product [Ectocarpus fasciculatus]